MEIVVSICKIFLFYLSYVVVFFLRVRLPSVTTRADTLFPYTTRFRSPFAGRGVGLRRGFALPIRWMTEVVLWVCVRLCRVSLLQPLRHPAQSGDRKSTRLNSSH